MVGLSLEGSLSTNLGMMFCPACPWSLYLCYVLSQSEENLHAHTSEAVIKAKVKWEIKNNTTHRKYWKYSRGEEVGSRE